MIYLKSGLAELGWTRLGKVLAVVFSVMCIAVSFGGGNMFQSNQSYAQVALVLPIFDGPAGSVVFGFSLAAVVGLVIIGGIKRIGQVAAVLVPVAPGKRGPRRRLPWRVRSRRLLIPRGQRSDGIESRRRVQRQIHHGKYRSRTSSPGLAPALLLAHSDDAISAALG